MNRMFAVAMSMLAMGGIAAGCGEDAKKSESRDAKPAAASTMEESSDMAQAPADIVDTAVKAGDFTKLVAAVQAAGLEETLRGDGPFTVFAPTDAAFAKLGEGTLNDLLKPESKDKLSGILTFHVVPSKALSSDLKDGQQLTTVNGEKLTVSIKDGVVTVGGAKVVTPDVEASNGVIHVIDTVLIPGAGA